MQITLVQNEIETAIREYVGRQLVVADDMQLKILLKATRGDEGFQAVIDIGPKPKDSAPDSMKRQPTPFVPPQSAGPTPTPAAPPTRQAPNPMAALVEAARNTEALNSETGEPAEDETSGEQEDEEDKADAEVAVKRLQEPVVEVQAAQTDAPAPTPEAGKTTGKRSLFTGLGKPKNH